MRAGRGSGRSRAGWIAAPVAAVVVAAIALGGSRLPVQTAAGPQPLAPGLGRTSSVCILPGEDTTDPSTGSATSPSPADPSGPATDPGSSPTSTPSGSASPSGSSSPSGAASATPSTPAGEPENLSVVAVNAREGSDGDGTLQASRMGGTDSSPVIDLTTRGSGKLLRSPQSSLVLNAEGVMSDDSAGVIYQRSESGQNRGLELGPCVVPGVDQWLTGLGGTSALRSNITLTNPDAVDAIVDLRIYGEDGPVAAAGASGLTVPADGSRTISLADLIDTAGSIAVEVRASTGRVGIMAEDIRTSGADPGGIDFHPGSAVPATRQIVPGVPGGKGNRTLHLVNPGQSRATVTLQILGPDGAFAPAGASTVAVPAQSTTSIDVTDGLAGQLGTVELTSDQPVTAAVRSISQSTDSGEDLAVSTAQPELGPLALAPLAIADQATNQLAVSNAGSRSVTVSLGLFDLNGVSLYTEDIPIAPHSTAGRQLTQPAPAYLTLKTPTGAEIYAGVTESSDQDSVAGLTAAALTSPDQSGRATVVLSDPDVAR